MNKKAAMFGLDARIALAIFGASSVISGAALYSAIQTAKATTLLADLKEVGKAWEQYYLDTGQNIEQIDTSGEGFYSLKTIGLVSNPGVSGWNGPYLSFTEQSTLRTDVVGHPSHPTGVWISISHNGTWGNSFDFRNDNTLSSARCLSGETCSLWATFVAIDDFSMIKRVDELVDGGDGGNVGSLRWNTFADLGYHNRIYLKIAPIKNPHD